MLNQLLPPFITVQKLQGVLEIQYQKVEFSLEELWEMSAFEKYEARDKYREIAKTARNMNEMITNLIIRVPFDTPDVEASVDTIARLIRKIQISADTIFAITNPPLTIDPNVIVNIILNMETASSRNTYQKYAKELLCYLPDAGLKVDVVS